MRARPLLRWVEDSLLVIGLIALAMWSQGHFDSRAFQANESSRLESALGGNDPEAPAGGIEAALFIDPSRTRPADRAAQRTTRKGDVLGKLEIPRIGISAIVAEGADLKTLKHAVGHIGSTALPGGPGNCALAGHRDTFLRGLGEVRGGDVIRLVTRDGTYSYRVEWGMVVDPHQIEVLDSTATPSLTLITCFPFEYIGHAPKRFVVRASEAD